MKMHRSTITDSAMLEKKEEDIVNVCVLSARRICYACVYTDARPYNCTYGDCAIAGTQARAYNVFFSNMAVSACWATAENTV
jgi:hypothetical protein